MMDAAVLIALPSLIGFSLLIVLGFRASKELHSSLLILCWSLAIGIGVSSALFYGVSRMVKPSAGTLLLVEAGFILVTVAVFFRMRKAATLIRFMRRNPPFPRAGIQPWTQAAAAALLLLMTAYSVLHWLQFPDGGWDAYSIYNLRSRFLFHGENPWDAVNSLIGYHRPDHPPMLTAFVARNWVLLGEEREFVPLMTALLAPVLTAGVLYSGVSLLKNGFAASLAVILLFLPPPMIASVPHLLSDLPLALYITSATVVFALTMHLEEGSWRGLCLTGLFLGLAAWTKAEGLVWMISLPIALAVTGCLRGEVWRRLGEAGWILAGGVGFIVLLAWFKFSIPYEEIPFLIPSFPLNGFRNVFDGQRMIDLMRLIPLELIKFGGVYGFVFPLFFWLTGMRRRPDFETFLTPLLLTLSFAAAAYFAAYVVTPNPVEIHIPRSMDRICLHFWPTVVLAAMTLSNLDSNDESAGHPTVAC